MKLKVTQAAEVTLGRQRAPQFEAGEHVTPYLRSANIVDGTIDSTDVKTMNFTPAEQSTYALRQGDVLVTEGSGSRATVGASAVWQGEVAGVICFQNTLLRLRPRPGVTDGRFIAWWARHAHAADMFGAVASGANILHLGADGLRRLALHVPTLAKQRRIADFLDDQVSRIDRIIAARRQQLSASGQLLASQSESAFAVLSEPATRSVPLRSLLDYFEDGDWIESPFITDEGVRLVQTGNVDVGRFREQGHRFISPETFHALECKEVFPGDVLISRLSPPVGRAARAPDLGVRMVTSVDVVIARPDKHRLDADYLVEYLSSPRHLSDTNEMARGATMQRVSRSQVGIFRVPLAPLSQQRALAMRLARERAWEASRRVALEQSIDLLAEYKQSLITAAVTGEFDVAAASGRGVPA